MSVGGVGFSNTKACGLKNQSNLSSLHCLPRTHPTQIRTRIHAAELTTDHSVKKLMWEVNLIKTPLLQRR